MSSVTQILKDNFTQIRESHRSFPKWNAENTRRPKFGDEVHAQFQNQKNNNTLHKNERNHLSICHKASWRNMCEVLDNYVNASESERDNNKNNLKKFIISLFDMNDDSQNNMGKAALWLVDEISKNEHPENSTQDLMHLATFMNSGKCNLRLGIQSPNASIGENFDPVVKRRRGLSRQMTFRTNIIANNLEKLISVVLKFSDNDHKKVLTSGDGWKDAEELRERNKKLSPKVRDELFSFNANIPEEFYSSQSDKEASSKWLEQHKCSQLSLDEENDNLENEDNDSDIEMEEEDCYGNSFSR